MSADRFADLVERTSRPNWDDEGGVAISADRWTRALNLAELVRAVVPNAPEPYFSACGDGNIFITWADATRSLAVELDGDTFHWVVRTPSGRARSQSDRVGPLFEAICLLFDEAP